jgi:hypothetical protein
MFCLFLESLQQELKFAATVCREFAATRQTRGKLAANFFFICRDYSRDYSRDHSRDYSRDHSRDFYRDDSRDDSRVFAATIAAIFCKNFAACLPRLYTQIFKISSHSRFEPATSFQTTKSSSQFS